MQKYEDNIAARLNGNALQALLGVSVTVTDDATGLPASLYSDNGVTPLAQPLTTDDEGYFGFFAANGEYTATFSGARIVPFTRAIRLYDPDDNPVVTQAALAAPTGAAGVGNGSEKISDAISVTVGRYGALPSPVVSTAAIQATVDSFVNADAAEINYGAMAFKSGIQYDANGEILFHRKSIVVDGRNSIIKWIGPNTAPMIHVTDSTRCTFKDLILLGDYTTPPTAAFYFEGLALGTTLGSNENCVIENVIIGRKFAIDTSTGGTLDPVPYARFQSGIVVAGVDGDNDEYCVRDTQVHSCDNYGIDFQNTQSIWSKLDNTLVNDCGTGVRIGCNMNMYAVNFNRNRVADIVGIRDLECSIFGMNTENTIIAVKSQAGADFYIAGMWARRDSLTPSNFLRWENGGSMVLRESTLSNGQGAVGDTIYYRPGSAKAGIIRVKDNNILSGELRSTWDIDTNVFSAVWPEIDIEQGKFKFKTTRPYADKSVTPTAVAAGASLGISAGGAVGVTDPFGKFYNVSYSLSMQGQHLTTMPYTDSDMYGRIFNVTASTITLGAGRMRWLDLGDRILSQGSASIDATSMLNNTGYTATIPVPGVSVGDYVACAADTIYANYIVTAYASAEDTVSLRIHNATGGTLDPAATVLRAAKVAPFGQFHAGYVYTPAAIANAATITISVSVPGAQLGAHAFVAYTKSLQGLTCTAHVSAADTVTIVMTNYTGASVTLAAGSFKVMVAF